MKLQLIAGWKKKPPAVQKSQTQTFEKGLDLEAGRAAKPAFLTAQRCEELLISEGSVLFCSSDTCMLTGCLLENICYQCSGVEAIRACSDAPCTSAEPTSTFFFLSESRALLRYSPAMGMSGTPRQGSHREGILLPVTMNRKPSPPPEPTQTFDVGEGVTARLHGA